IFFDRLHQRVDFRRSYGDRWQSHDSAVAGEDSGKRFTDDGMDTEAIEGLGRVLARRAAAEVFIDKKYRCSLVFRVVELMVFFTPGCILSLVNDLIITNTREHSL